MLEDLSVCCTAKYNEYKEKNKDFFNNKVILSFLKSPQNEKLLMKYICEPNRKNKKIIDETFRRFYFNIRFVSFVSSTLHFNAINYDKKVNKYTRANMLTIDSSEGYDQKFSFKDLIEDTSALEVLENSIYKEIKDYITEPQLYYAVTKLTNKQRQIIDLCYVYGLNDTEISQLLNKTQQSISKTHKKALEKLKSNLTMGGSVTFDSRNA
ncbi:sigma-70 family RNA polymerase sigma factor [Solibacillus sp. CAU 1738]|uniref:sigma-70 family RNA polymerase sigma factor n=1 Tax=Solibacillus sp. CAU 1738 TaxID=3140363 RepID=UPI003261D4A3